jgi:hypothetical protein
MRRATLLLALLACAAATAAAAQPADPMRAQVAALTARMPAGTRLLREPWMGALAQGASDDIWIGLRAGRTYHLIPLCDQDCSEVDLRMYDAAGTEVAHASDMDDIDILTITPARGGRYRMRMVMLGCSAAPCRYAIAMYGGAPPGR